MKKTYNRKDKDLTLTPYILINSNAGCGGMIEKESRVELSKVTLATESEADNGGSDESRENVVAFTLFGNAA